MGDESRFADRPIDANSDYQARADLLSGSDVALPAKGRIDVVTHVARASHSVRDHQRPGEVGEHVEEAVDVHVPQAGNEKFAAPLDDARSAQRGCRRGRTRVRDSTAAY